MGSVNIVEVLRNYSDLVLASGFEISHEHVGMLNYRVLEQSSYK